MLFPWSLLSALCLLRVSWGWGLTSNGVLSRKWWIKGWKNPIYLTLYCFGCFLNQYHFWFASSTLHKLLLSCYIRGKIPNLKNSVNMQKPPSEPPSAAQSSLMLTAATLTTQMHLWNVKTFPIYKPLLQTDHRLAFTLDLSIFLGLQLHHTEIIEKKKKNQNKPMKIRTKKPSEATLSEAYWDSGPGRILWSEPADPLPLTLLHWTAHNDTWPHAMKVGFAGVTSLELSTAMLWGQNTEQRLCSALLPSKKPQTSCSITLWALLLPPREPHQNKAPPVPHLPHCRGCHILDLS